MSGDLFLAGGGNTTKMYDLPLEKFEMSYIEKATDVKELEKIVKVLRSGAEGSYPHLEIAAEKRLKELEPESRILRKTTPVSKKTDLPTAEQDKIGSEITEFLDDISNVDRMLRKRPTGGQRKDEVPVRGVAVKINKENVQSNKSPKPRDYREWEKLEKTINDDELEKEPSDEKPGTKRADIATEIDVSGKSEIEKRRLAEMDKEKGNEYFNSGDYDSAIVYYTRSLSIIPSPASYNNRALVYLKRENYSRCIGDCEAVLEVEPNNVKALLRRGSSYKAQCEYSKAKRDFLRVLELEPQNLRADKLLKETDNAWRTKGKKLRIDEVEGEEPVNEHLNIGTNANVGSVPHDSSEIVENGPTENVDVDNMETSEPDAAKSKTRRIHIEETDSDEEETEKAEETTVVDDARETVRNEAEPAVKKHTAAIEETSSTSDAASVKTASTDISSDSDLTTNSSDTSPVHQPYVPQRPILETIPLPPKLADLKAKGNDEFRSGQFVQALHHYNELILELSQVPEQVVNLATIYNNRASAYFKIGDCKAAIDDCDQSLTHVPHSVKALLKRALAYETLEKYKEAYRDYQHVLAVDTTVDQAQEGLGRCRKILFSQYGKDWRSKVPNVLVNTYDVPLVIPESGVSPSEHLQKFQVEAQKPVQEKVQRKDIEQEVDETIAVKQEVPSEPSKRQSKKSPQKTAEEMKSPPETAEEMKSTPETAEEMKSTPETAEEMKSTPEMAEEIKSTPEIAEEMKSTQKIAEEMHSIPEAEPNVFQPMESPETRHESLKSLGNSLVGEGEYKQAIDFYTQCLEIFQDRSAVYTNRALCYLKVDEPVKAIADCDRAIEIEPSNVKAWFRRALGRKMQNDYRNCMSDLLQVLRTDSNNGAAKKEMEIVKKAYHDTFAKEQKERKREEAKKGKAAKEKHGKKETSGKKGKRLIEIVAESKNSEYGVGKPTEHSKVETKNSESDSKKLKEHLKSKAETKTADSVSKKLKEQSKVEGKTRESESKKPTTEKTESKIETKNLECELRKSTQQTKLETESEEKMMPTDQSKPKADPNPQERKTKIKKESNSKNKKNSKVAGENAPEALPPGVPIMQNKESPFEFMNAWNSLKGSQNFAAYAGVLGQIQPRLLSKLIGNKLDHEILSTILRTIHDHIVDKDMSRAYHLLHHLKNVERFEMATMFMSNLDKVSVRDALAKMSLSNECPGSKLDIAVLAKAYKI